MDEFRSDSEVMEGTVRPSGAWISDTSYWIPRHFVESAWLEHAPFASWLVDAIRPTAIAELGTHNGFSYFVFCEAIARLGIPARAFALDSWQGDDQAGFYGSEVYESVSTINEAEYSAFSTLLRGYFDDGLESIPDGSIDLLHIDGRHGYDDVRHDFESWRPKLSDRGVVIFHDTAELQEGFGVWRFWNELTAQYPSFTFEHGHGLGVLAVGANIPQRLRSFLDEGVLKASEIKDFYESRGAEIADLYELRVRAAEVSDLKGQIQVAGQQLDEKDRVAALHERERLGLVGQIERIHGSTSWRVTKPLRLLSPAIRRHRG